MNIKYRSLFILVMSVYCLNLQANDNPLTQFIDNAEYELDTSVTGYFKTPPANNADRDDLLQYKGSRAGYDFFGLVHHDEKFYSL